MRMLRAALCVAVLTFVASAAKTLDIYFIDVEGGQATLIVTPAGESLLVDTGYWGNNGRDAGRIMAAARDAGIKRIDYLLITHFHGDHNGGVMDLAPQIPIGTFIDHGSLTSDAPRDSPFPELSLSVYNAYLGVRAKGKHVEPKVGDRIPLKGPGSIEAVVVSSAGATIATPLPGAGQPNAACTPTAPEASEKTENPRSTGIHLRFGRFSFIDVGDLTGAPLFALFCPNNMLGRADVYLLPHHGGDDVSHPAYVAAVRPRAAVVNNGATKGGDPKMFAMLHTAARAAGSAGLDVWQLHRSTKNGSENFADERIANLDETTGHWIKLSAGSDGSFRVTNQRTGAVKTYPRPAR